MSVLVFVNGCLLKLLLFISLLSTVESCYNTSQHGKQKDYKSHKNYPLLADEEGCGTSFTNRIIGGQDAGLGQYPWLVMIDGAGGFCGGVLINRLYVVTAAHCAPLMRSSGRSPGRLLVGEYHLMTRLDCQLGHCAPPIQVAYPESVLTPPGWDLFKDIGIGPFDIALVRLKEKVTFNDYVKPICLPFENEDHIDIANKTTEVAGWGVIKLSSKYQGAQKAMVPQTLKLKMFSRAVCGVEFEKMLGSKFKTAGIEEEVEPTTICGGGVVGQDSCTGDSGGPLMRARVVDGMPAYALMGVVSFGITECATKEVPGFYTDVRLFLDWILDNIKP